MISGLVLANCYLDQEALAETAISQIDEVVEVHQTIGVYDLIVKVLVPDEQTLGKVVMDIRSTRGVRSVLTNIIYQQEAGPAAMAA